MSTNRPNSELALVLEVARLGKARGLTIEPGSFMARRVEQAEAKLANLDESEIAELRTAVTSKARCRVEESLMLRECLSSGVSARTNAFSLTTDGGFFQRG
jgi:hypothetical protein